LGNTPENTKHNDILLNGSYSSRIENLSNSRRLLTLVVDKNTYHMKNFALELEADATSQGQKAKMDMKVNMTSDESKEVTLSVPSDLTDTPETSLKTFFSS